MKKDQKMTDVRVKKKIAGLREFLMSYIVMLILVGLQRGILEIPGFHDLSDFWQINIIMLYWALVALVFCLITSWQMRQHYDRPMRRLSAAAKKLRMVIFLFLRNRSIRRTNTTILT